MMNTEKRGDKPDEQHIDQSPAVNYDIKRKGYTLLSKEKLIDLLLALEKTSEDDAKSHADYKKAVSSKVRRLEDENQILQEALHQSRVEAVKGQNDSFLIMVESGSTALVPTFNPEILWK